MTPLQTVQNIQKLLFIHCHFVRNTNHMGQGETTLSEDQMVPPSLAKYTSLFSTDNSTNNMFLFDESMLGIHCIFNNNNSDN